MLAVTYSACQKDPDPTYISMEEYLKKHNITNYQQTPSGIIYNIERQGTGDFPQTGDRVRVHYTGYHMNDKEFDSSYKRGQPFYFDLGSNQAIAGFSQSVALLKTGGIGTFFIPYELAYGVEGRGNIKTKEDLKFVIKLVRFAKPASLDAK